MDVAPAPLQQFMMCVLQRQGCRGGRGDVDDGDSICGGSGGDSDSGGSDGHGNWPKAIETAHDIKWQNRTEKIRARRKKLQRERVRTFLLPKLTLRVRCAISL